MLVVGLWTEAKDGGQGGRYAEVIQASRLRILNMAHRHIPHGHKCRYHYLVDFRSPQVDVPSCILCVEWARQSDLVGEVLIHYTWLHLDDPCILWPIYSHHCLQFGDTGPQSYPVSFGPCLDMKFKP